MATQEIPSGNGMIDLLGPPPLLVNGTMLTLEHIMQRLEIIENKVAIVELIENLDKKIHNHITQYGSKVGVTRKNLREKEPFATNEFLDFLPRSLIINKNKEPPRGYVCSIEELHTKDDNT